MKHGHRKFRSKLGPKKREKKIARKGLKRLNYPNAFLIKRHGLNFKRKPSKAQIAAKSWEVYPIQEMEKIREKLGITGLEKNEDTIYSFIDLGVGKKQLDLVPKYIQNIRFREIQDQKFDWSVLVITLS